MKRDYINGGYHSNRLISIRGGTLMELPPDVRLNEDAGLVEKLRNVMAKKCLPTGEVGSFPFLWGPHV